MKEQAQGHKICSKSSFSWQKSDQMLQHRACMYVYVCINEWHMTTKDRIYCIKELPELINQFFQ